MTPNCGQGPEDEKRTRDLEQRKKTFKVKEQDLENPRETQRLEQSKKKEKKEERRVK